jgi:hypothetical protein
MTTMRYRLRRKLEREVGAGRLVDERVRRSVGNGLDPIPIRP